MKDISIEELAAISPEIHAAATRVGCTHVRLTGRVWPGGQVSGPPAQALRYLEFSWYKAALLNEEPIFEESDPHAFAALLKTYGLADDEPYPEPVVPVSSSAEEKPPKDATAGAIPTPKEALELQILPSTRSELQRQATAVGLDVAAYLDHLFGHRSPEAALSR